MQIFTLEHVSPVYLLVLSIKLRSTRTYVAGQFTNVKVKAFITDWEMIKNDLSQILKPFSTMWFQACMGWQSSSHEWVKKCIWQEERGIHICQLILIEGCCKNPMGLLVRVTHGKMPRFNNDVIKHLWSVLPTLDKFWN